MVWGIKPKTSHVGYVGVLVIVILQSILILEFGFFFSGLTQWSSGTTTNLLPWGFISKGALEKTKAYSRQHMYSCSSPESTILIYKAEFQNFIGMTFTNY